MMACITASLIDCSSGSPVRCLSQTLIVGNIVTSSVLQPHSSSVSTSTARIAVLETPKFVRASSNISSAASQNTQNSEVYMIMQLHFPHAVFVSILDTGIASVFIVLSLGGFPDHSDDICSCTDIWECQDCIQPLTYYIIVINML
jgi:hypothetical protein